jgi:hypothetical protein
MKKLLLAAALAVVPTAATAPTEWTANFRRCEIDKWFTRGEDAYEFDGEGRLLVSIKPADVPAIERGNRDSQEVRQVLVVRSRARRRTAEALPHTEVR